jgi:hypothetical protein
MGSDTTCAVIAEQVSWEWLERQLAERILAAERTAPESPTLAELLGGRGQRSAKRLSRKEKQRAD